MKGNFALQDEASASYIAENFRKFTDLLSINSALAKRIQESTDPCTIFVPNAEAFTKLDSAVLSKLRDPRNGEVVEKITAYHFIEGSLLCEEDIYKAGAVVTEGGEVPVSRGKSGGFLGLGGKEDGSVKLNNAAIVNSVQIGNAIVHEMDGFINPFLLYRFLDAVRIPGMK